MAKYAHGSLEYIAFPLTDFPVDQADVITDPVWLAFMLDQTAEPTDADLVVAEWSVKDGVPHMQVLRGPGALELDRGTYKAWFKIGDSPETPLRKIPGTTTIE
jgi:hypothetical protein